MAGAAAELVVPVAVHPSPASPLCVAVQNRFPPINFIYGHFHNSIRAELTLLAERVRSLEVPREDVEGMLTDLRKRYKFLEQVYKYHSNVEDEVLYPALDSKVRNVTLAYSIEHQDEEILFEQLSQLLSKALDEPDASRKGTIRALICKVEEIHTTLRKHLAKEEEQLLPLLLQHFNFAEQAELVAQFLYSIPLETVERVLSQLKPRIPRDEQEQLLVEIRNVIPDNLLSQLLMTWLQPAADAGLGPQDQRAPGTIGPASSSATGGRAVCVPAASAPGATHAHPPAALAPRDQRPAATFVCCGNPDACMLGPAPRQPQAVAPAIGSATHDVSAPPSVVVGLQSEDRPDSTVPAGDAGRAGPSPSTGACASGSSPGSAQSAVRAPLQDIIHFHRIICSSLADFAREARSLQQGRDAMAPQLSSLLDRHRFLRSVYVFHSISEEEVLFPEVQSLAASHVGGAAAHQCERDHQAELSSFEDLGRLLADVRAFARRGRKEVSPMLEKLCCSAEAVHESIRHHMQREEADVFPLLEAHLCEAAQRVLVYRTIRAMPLRLLERVMPWVVSGLDNAAAAALLTNIRLGAPASDQALVELLSRWARRGRRGISPGGGGGAGAGDAAATAGGSGLAGGRQGSGSLPGSGGDAADGWETGPEPGGSGASFVRTSTCGPRFLRDSLPYGATASGYDCGFVATAVTEDGADSKRRRVSASAGLGGHLPGKEGLAGKVPRLAGEGALDPVGGVACGGILYPPGFDGSIAGGDEVGLEDGDDDGDEQELSTAPRALLLNQTSGSLDERAAAVRSASGRGGSPGGGAGAGFGGQPSRRGPAAAIAAAAVAAGPSQVSGPGGSRSCMCVAVGSGVGGGYNPIDHIFQFHKALRQELKQLEADAMTLEQAVLVRVRHQQQQQQLQIQQQQSEHPGGGMLGREPEAGRAVVQTPPRRVPTPTQVPGEAGLMGSADGGGTGGGCGGGVGGGTAVSHGRGGVLPIVQNFHGRFQFLQGIYRAHSKAEDEIVFPALEAKQALRNVSHAYTLDHRQEEHLFADLERAIDSLRAVDLTAADSEDELSRQVMGVRRMCAAIRASLETHIRSEESELWPLFTEHFSREEQRYLVGVIIGRTGAQVLQALLPWVSETFSAEERDAMMDSLREATRNTMFDQWLEAVQAGGAAASGYNGSGAAAGGGAVAAGGGAGSTSGGAGGWGSGWTGPDGSAASRSSSLGAPAEQDQQQLQLQLQLPQAAHQLQHQQPRKDGAAVCRHSGPCTAPAVAAPAGNQQLQQVAEYLAGAAGVAGGTVPTPSPASAGGGSGGSGGPSEADSSLMSFRPGWEDIFRMNQQQLEAAIHRVSNDSSLEPERKAYLMQNIMVSRYIVAQQRRMVNSEAAAMAEAATPAVAAPSPAPAVVPGASPAAGGQGARRAALEGPGAATPPLAPTGASVTGMLPVAPDTALGVDAGAPLALPHRTFHNALTGVLGCPHYQRKCQLVAPCCNQIFTCRLCHDEACDHRLDRYAVSEMRCMLCGLRQPVGPTCRCCATPMARYVCNICHLFDDAPGKDIYHCPFCNVCRRGRGLGVDFFHCMNCNACMSLSLFSSHKCREKCIEGNCPVCHEALFDSSQPIKELPCGHFMHSTCFLTYTRYNYTCPLCCKSVGDMSVYFQMLDSLLASERLPPEYAGRMQQVLCNDCGKLGFAPFHFVYHSCPHCRSYNTRVM